MKYDLLTIGDTTLDTFLSLGKKEAQVLTSRNGASQLLCLNFGDKIPISEIHDCIAGNASNVAVAGSRLGLNSAIWTILGNDDVGHRALDKFKLENIKTKFVEFDKKRRSNTSFIVNYFAERTILIYHKKRIYIFPKEIQAKAIYLTSMNNSWDRIIDPLLANLKKNSSRLFYQPGTFQLVTKNRKVSQLLINSEAIFVNREEAELMTKSSRKINIKSLLLRLYDLGPKIVVITDGEKGAYYYAENHFHFLDIDEKVKPIERTGAGDAFASGFTVAYLKGKNIADCMQYGAVNSESVIQEIGPQRGILRKSLIDEIVASRKKRIKVREI
ncbi:MAG: Carbohydrate kinase [Berkelbacteria bacterium GW2011_GWA2_35_9]|uniref:Carbohydrate kinase n=1 Tax=Berkelbacteria bacterium GW2011_GWA2_35_9 TaxID=1618333 RepID=A0A0G0D6V4_9BACT|nr:MAG: Carbohydrate kinase [Berkelbacteria bacterium GW2011_GWA2_35_9]